MIKAKSIATAIAAGSLVLNLFATTAFADTVTVTGNGTDSSNTVSTNNDSSTTVTQNNKAIVTNTVSSKADTGNNTASYNTGGNVGVSTGDATSNTQVSTVANLNQASVSNCGCTNNSTDVTISGNGASSTNNVGVHSSDESGTSLFQNNMASVTNNVGSTANTGNNTASFNTGANGGNVTVSTGNAKGIVGISNMANANLATIGGTGNGTGSNGSSALILGNGADSTNHITLDSNNSALIEQGNSASVTNNVGSDVNSGNNTSSYNTGANVSVDTGMSTSIVGVDNKVNFNAANIDCGCFTTGDLLKIADNGASTNNKITDSTGGSLNVFQGGDNGNMALLDNNVSGQGNTGNSTASFNTGAVVGVDPTSIMTGDSSSSTGVSNAGNVNVFGPMADMVTLPGNVNITFDWNAFLGMFGM